MTTTPKPMCDGPVADPGRTDSTSRAALGDLAQQLFARYRAASGDAVAEGLCRIVVVIGAGASNAACGLPNAAELAARIEKAVVDVRIPRRLVEAELERLELVNRMAPTDFETRLLALSKFDSKSVLNELRKACDYAHYPSLTYELIAHLLKHGFVDAVVNFNFDELLDQSIDEELGPNQYVRIIGDGDWSRNLRADSDDAYRFDLPLYVKPHGTVGNPESLRFTREAYFALPPDTAHLMRVLLRGDPVTSFFDGTRSQGPGGKADSGPPPARPLCLLVLGHALGSFEFNKLMEQAPSATRMYVTNLAGCPPPESNKEWPECMRAFAAGRGISIPDQGDGLDAVMGELWAQVSSLADAAEQDKPWLQLRDVLRHQLISKLFKATRPGTLKRTSEFQATHDYFLDRLTVELALSIAKTKGFVNLRQLRDGRPGRFFRLLVDHDKRHGQPPLEFTRRMEELGMERRDTSADCYWHKSVPKDAAGGAKRLTADKDTFERDMSEMLWTGCNKLLTENRRVKLARSPALLSDTMSAMFHGDEVEIAPQHHGAHATFRFRSPKALRTVAELRRVTREMMNDPSWCLLLCVAESGEWLTRPLFRDLLGQSDRRVCVIVADSVMTGSLDAMLHTRVESLPWYLHNRHMTIRLRDVGGKVSPDSAVYFERRYRSTMISPVLLQDPSDLDQAFDDFTVYWLKAMRHKEGKSDTLQHTLEQLRQERTDLLHQWMRAA